MQYCRRCLMPSTKPHISFDDEMVCGACRAHDRKNQHVDSINWDARADEFEELIEATRSRRAPYFDVLVPVSGGKDSITQVHRLLGRNLRILAVNVDYGIKTEIGRQNLAVVNRMGASLSIFQPEPELHWKMIRIGLEEYGDPDLMSHTLLYAYPMHTAKQLEIPLVLLGENSALEYTGDSAIGESPVATREWFEKYVANNGQDARHVSEAHGIPMEKLKCYSFPADLPESGVTAAFMSYYFPWDSEEHFRIAKSHGFRELDAPMEGTYRTFAGIDEKINRIHQYLKVLKFGYGRATDHACDDIRSGRLTREDAIEKVRAHDLVPLTRYFTDEFVALANMDQSSFQTALEQWRNTDIWERNNRGEWFIPGHLSDDAGDFGKAHES